MTAKKNRRRGTATVEFALCVPILLTVLIGCVELAGVLQLEHTVRMAAFEGARAGLVLDASTADVTQAANTALAATKVKHATVTVTPKALTYGTPSVSVTVTVKPGDEGWALYFIKQNTQITATVALDREVQALSAP